jgi:hypothetical protein
LGRTFAAVKNSVRCVVLNTCYSELQGKAIAEHIACVVGVSGEIGDKDASVFASTFYSSIGSGYSIGEAFEQGRLAIGYKNSQVDNRLVLLGDGGAAQIRFGKRRTANTLQAGALVAATVMIIGGAMLLVGQTLLPTNTERDGQSPDVSAVDSGPQQPTDAFSREETVMAQQGLVPMSVKVGEDETLNVDGAEINVSVHDFPPLSEGNLSDEDWVLVSLTTLGSRSFRLFEGDCAIEEPFVVSFVGLDSKIPIICPYYAQFNVRLLSEDAIRPDCNLPLQD